MFVYSPHLDDCYDCATISFGVERCSGSRKTTYSAGEDILFHLAQQFMNRPHFLSRVLCSLPYARIEPNFYRGFLILGRSM